MYVKLIRSVHEVRNGRNGIRSASGFGSLFEGEICNFMLSRTGVYTPRIYIKVNLERIESREEWRRILLSQFKISNVEKVS